MQLAGVNWMINTHTTHVSDALKALEELVEKWRNKAVESREESGRIRRTVYVATDAEANCLIRADVWDADADELATALARVRQQLAWDTELSAAKAATKRMPCGHLFADFHPGEIHFSEIDVVDSEKTRMGKCLGCERDRLARELGERTVDGCRFHSAPDGADRTAEISPKSESRLDAGRPKANSAEMPTAPTYFEQQVAERERLAREGAHQEAIKCISSMMDRIHRMAIELNAAPCQPRIEYWTRLAEEDADEFRASVARPGKREQTIPLPGQSKFTQGSQK
jgi:hypothetical protein